MPLFAGGDLVDALAGDGIHGARMRALIVGLVAQRATDQLRAAHRI
jgi:hypothetical protein